MRNRKILIFSTAYYPFVGGAEVAIKEITDRISSIQFDLVTARFNPKLPAIQKIGNVNIYRLGVGLPTLDKLLLPFLGTIKAISLTNKNHYDFYWCMMASFASGAAYIANILKFWKTVPIILSLQEGDSEEHFKYRWFGLINLAWSLALKNTKVLTVLSSYLAERAKKFGYTGEIKIIPNGVDIDRFKIELSKEEKINVRNILGLKENDVVLITTSRLNIKNAIGDVIKSLPKLSENIKFVILGEGELEVELKKLARELNVSDRVIFKGFVSHNEMPKYLRASDIFIRPSLSEGFGNSFIEAMAARLPVIATPVGGIVDFLIDPAKFEPSEMHSGMEGQTGYFCEPRNPQSIANTVQRVISDPNKNQVIENAYKMVSEKYDWSLIANQMRIVFEKPI